MLRLMAAGRPAAPRRRDGVSGVSVRVSESQAQHELQWGPGGQEIAACHSVSSVGRPQAGQNILQIAYRGR